MTTPTFTAPPTAPQRTDAPATFVTRANAFVAWFATLYTELVAFVSWAVTTAAQVAADAVTAASAAVTASAAGAAGVAATSYAATSGSSHSLTTGSKTFTLDQTSRAFASPDQVIIARRSDPTARLMCTVNSLSGVTLTVTANSFEPAAGGGPYTDWAIVEAFYASPGATVAQMNAAASKLVAVTPGILKDAAAPVALTYASTVTPDLANGKRFTLSASASFTLGNPTHCAPGDVIEIFVTNTAGAIVLAVASAWKRQNGLFVMDPASGHTNKITGIVETVDGSANATAITYGGLRNPS